MLQMLKPIIADTSCFIILTNIEELDLLRKVYGQIITTAEIASEYGKTLPNWVEVGVVQDIDKQKLLEIQVDKGEASALALALEIPGSTVILDDYPARKVVVKLGLDLTGTLGVIIKAKLKGVILSIEPILAKIKQTNFRITKEVELEALREADEI